MFSWRRIVLNRLHCLLHVVRFCASDRVAGVYALISALHNNASKSLMHAPTGACMVEIALEEEFFSMRTFAAVGGVYVEISRCPFLQRLLIIMPLRKPPFL